MTRPLIEIVVPVYREGASLAASVERILVCTQVLSGYEVGLLVVDDGSDDDTFAIASEMGARHPQLRVMRFTRNFGKEAAIAAGLRHSRGAAVVVMDGDLQHPPELIADFVAAWERGAKVVEGVHRRRRGGVRGQQARAFYWLFHSLVHMPIDNHTDFKLLDREVVDAYLRLKETRKFFRGLIAWMGYPAERIEFASPARESGETRWSLSRLLRYGWNSTLSFSAAPLYMIGALGATAILAGLILLAVSLFRYITGSALPGFTTVIFLMVLFSGAQLLALGALGSFVARVYEEVKARPEYVVAETRNMPQDETCR